MLKTDLDKLTIHKMEGDFSPLYTESSIAFIKNINGEIIDYEFVDFVLIKSAEDVYQEYLNPPLPKPTVEDFNLEMDYRVTMLEMIGGI